MGLDLTGYQLLQGTKPIITKDLEAVVAKENISLLVYSKPFVKGFLGTQSLAFAIQAACLNSNKYIIAAPLAIALLSFSSAAYDLYKNNRKY